MCLMRVPEAQPNKEKNTDRSELAQQLCWLADGAATNSTGCWCNGEKASEEHVRQAKETWPFPYASKPDRVDLMMSQTAIGDDEESLLRSM